MSVRFAAMNELGPGAVVGGWRVERVLGAGAMGQVYLSLGPQGERAALKVVPGELTGDQRFRRRFQRETRLAAATWTARISTWRSPNGGAFTPPTPA